MLHRRLQLELSTTNTASAENLKTIVLGNVSPADKWTDEDAKYFKNRDITYFQSEGVYRIVGTYLFNSSSKALQIYNLLTSPIAGVSGKVNLHYCPVEGSISDWLGCKQDMRAGYLENIWP